MLNFFKAKKSHTVWFNLHQTVEKTKLRNEAQISGFQELETGGCRMGGQGEV